MERVRRGKTKFDPNRIIMSGGATGAHELIAFCLADPGDAFLVPTPYYPGYVNWLSKTNKLCIDPALSHENTLSHNLIRRGKNDIIGSIIIINSCNLYT